MSKVSQNRLEWVLFGLACQCLRRIGGVGRDSDGPAVELTLPCALGECWCMTEPLHLFLVEDNEEVAFLMRLHLELAGFRVTACRTGADALIVLANKLFDLVLLDHFLPDMDGLTLLQTMLRENIRTPVLVMTAHRNVKSNVKVATEALKAGGLDFVLKDDALTFIAELPSACARR